MKAIYNKQKSLTARVSLTEISTWTPILPIASAKPYGRQFTSLGISLGKITMNYKLLLAAPLMIVALNAQAGKGGVGAIFGALIGGAVGNAVGKSVSQKMTVDEALVRVVDQLNKQLPMTVDRDTRLDTTQAGPGRAFTYHYTMVTARASEIDTTVFYRAMSSHLRNSVCTNPDMQVFFQNGVTVSYSYRGSDGRHVTKVVITPRDCGIA